MLLAAAFIMVNQFNGFEGLTVGSIIAGVLAAAFLVQCIAQASFAILPIPLAVLYIAFQSHFDLPYMQPWMLILAAVFTVIGLSVLMPNNKYIGIINLDSNSNDTSKNTEACDDNNPIINANFTGISRYIHANALETVRINCHFGGLELFLDQATLSPNGAEIYCNCKFGGIVIVAPKNWRIVDKLNCTLGGVENKNRHSMADDAPVLTILGDITVGGVEIKY
jgi:hypothetical protein